MTTAAGVLQGFKVLDFSQMLSGPTATRLMAEMGAEVIKLEFSPGGDPVRLLPFQRNGRTSYYIQQNRGKKSVGINLRDPRAKEIVRKLVAQVDVVIENFSPGVIGRMGFGWDEVHKLNPRAVMASISAFGQTGPLSTIPGYDYMAASYAGVISMIGEAGEAPYFPMLAIGDVTTGVHAVAGIVSALLYRERGGSGQYVELSLLDSYFHCHELNVAVYSASGGEVKPTRCGRHHYAGGPLGIYPCRKGFLFIAVLPNNWERFCIAIQRPELVNDPRFADNALRVQNRDALNVEIQAYLDRFDSAMEAGHKLGHVGHIPVAPILSIEEAVSHPHMTERGTVRTIKDPVYGDFQVPGMPIRFSEFPGQADLRADYMGEHNVEVLMRYAGLDEAEVRSLEREGVLVARPDVAAKAA